MGLIETHRNVAFEIVVEVVFADGKPVGIEINPSDACLRVYDEDTNEYDNDYDNTDYEAVVAYLKSFQRV